MLRRTLISAALATTLAIGISSPAQAQTEIQWWHSMGGALGEALNGLADKFNAEQKDYKVVTSYKGSYPESMTAAIAAFRAGQAPHILQVFEVGTATMMAAKGAVKPVYQLMKETGEPFDPKAYLPTVTGYYSDVQGNMLSLPFNSSTALFYIDRNKFKAAGLPPVAPKTWKELVATAEKLKAAGQDCVFTSGGGIYNPRVFGGGRDLSETIILAQADLVEAERNLDNLLNSNLYKAQAQLNLANAQDAYERAVWSSFQGDTARTTNQNKIDAASAAVTLAEDKVNDAEENYDKVDERDDDDPLKAGALSTLANARETLEKAKKDLNYLVENPGEKELAISEGKVAVALAEYEDAQREWERRKDGADPDDITAAEARIASIKATIGLSQISAPFSGTITEVNAMVGDQVTTGNNAFRLDDLSHLLVDVQVPEVDINRIRVGQDVDLTFDAISNKAYQGRVHSVAQVGTIQNGLVNFKITIEILNPDEQVLPGMTAAVNIIVSQLEDVLTVPKRAVRLVDNQSVVYILKNGIPTPVNIEIGSSSDTMSEIVSGDLKEGDKVILNPPSSFLDMDFGGGPPF